MEKKYKDIIFIIVLILLIFIMNGFILFLINMNDIKAYECKKPFIVDISLEQDSSVLFRYLNDDLVWEPWENLTNGANVIELKTICYND